MLRTILVTLQLTGLLSLKLLFSGDIEMKMDSPDQIDAGKEIKVQIVIDKGDLSSFSRFQMELPNGLTAVNVSSANADFSFKDQKVRLIWLKLPSEKTLTFSFNIICNERLKGNFNLSGKFSYIDNNERKFVSIEPKQIAIVPNPDISPELLVDINDFGKSIYQGEGVFSADQIVCIRQKPVWNETNGEFIVNVLVNKENLKKFAKIEENVPKGYTALNLNSKEGIFTFKDGKVKYLWMNLPGDKYFTVSYKLIPTNGANGALISGTFSYIHDDKTQSINIIEKDVDMANLSPENVKEILKAQPLIADLSQQQQQTITDNQVINTQQQPDIKPVDTPETVIAQVKEPNIIKRIPDYQADLLEPQSGIYYRVQIAAGHKPVNVKRYFRKYKLDNKIYKEQHDGWIKYSTGTFSVYKDARDYRVHLWNTTTITDAFVSAYNEGKRITVQEALMVANQKWYK
jgi:hypothetical protein